MDALVCDFLKVVGVVQLFVRSYHTFGVGWRIFFARETVGRCDHEAKLSIMSSMRTVQPVGHSTHDRGGERS